MHRTDPPTTTSSHGSIIVVDSDPASLLTLAGILHSQGYRCVCARSFQSVLESEHLDPTDLIVWDVGDQAPTALQSLTALRGRTGSHTAAILLADHRWAGLEQKAELVPEATRVLFKPIDPNVLMALASQLLLTETLVQSHQKRGSRPSRPGWVKL